MIVMRKRKIISLASAIFILFLIYQGALTPDNDYQKTERYKLYEISLDGDYQLELLRYKFKRLAIVFKQKNRIRILFPSHLEEEITQILGKHRMKFQKLSNDVAELGKQNRHNINKRSATKGLIDFKRYHRFDTINNYLISVAQKYPHLAKLQTLGKSYEGRDLNALYIANGGNINFTMGLRPVILIDGGIHAREWISHSAVVYIINQLVENSKYYGDELAMFDWMVWPVVNPDGYEYSHVSDRDWHKNRRPSSPNNSKCIGTDLNRNFGFYWSYSGSSFDPCSTVYQGPAPFSEPESVALRDLLLKLNTNCFMYITLHSYGRYILYPWGYESSKPPSWQIMDDIAVLGAKAIEEYTGTNYAIGAAGKVLFPASGGSYDFAFAEAKIPIVFCMDLPSGGNGFEPPRNKILPIVSETWLGIRTMAMEAYSNYLRSCANKNTLLFIMMLELCLLIETMF